MRAVAKRLLMLLTLGKQAFCTLGCTLSRTLVDRKLSVLLFKSLQRFCHFFVVSQLHSLLLAIIQISNFLW